MYQAHRTRNVLLYTCHDETPFGHDPFVYENYIGIITSGSADHYTEKGVITYPTGSLCLVKRNQLLKVVKKPDGQKPFATITVFLEQETLKQYSEEHNIKADGIYTGESVSLVENDAFLAGYFGSLLPYFDQPEKLTPILAQAKTTEVIALLLRNPALKNFLFDFSEPHKIDLEAYMQRHYSYNVPLTQFAKLTGRSLSTFKRDFAKIFSLTPEKWLQKQRLTQAYFLVNQQHKRPSDIYLELGFETLSHFSYAFKKQFGQTLTELQTPARAQRLQG
ncbi:AraC family transcriptional regulator [Hymenobacter sp. BT559]|jgi:AraC-like DNA-binding protein|uniref:helix-turn-helix domain-containing protein n=1 Tax=Hymenobacter sp. BT559 TaxID=2795729 RepID=UPI0018ED845D|nr:AraC family transcriptional regulator [Hymenobacter sp. BT559]MBJ6142804.1 helix-turn-helix transcriptional regulator [Hymenobacter sp. BT559]